MPDIEKILRFIVEQFEYTPMGIFFDTHTTIMIIFFVMVTGIAIVIDTMLTHTFPAFTLIALLLFAGSAGMKAYQRYLMKKNKFFDR